MTRIVLYLFTGIY